MLQKEGEILAVFNQARSWREGWTKGCVRSARRSGRDPAIRTHERQRFVNFSSTLEKLGWRIYETSEGVHWTYSRRVAVLLLRLRHIL